MLPTVKINTCHNDTYCCLPLQFDFLTCQSHPGMLRFYHWYIAAFLLPIACFICRRLLGAFLLPVACCLYAAS